MGLDMYLNKRTYIGSNFDHRNVEVNISIKMDGVEVPINPKRISYIEEQVGYWRKANHIHKWFVENVQDGDDDCGEYDVSKKDLETLLALCKQVKENPDKAHELLPTKKGFFFGSTEYDEFYMKDIDDTISIIETVLSENTNPEYLTFDIQYTSSW